MSLKIKEDVMSSLTDDIIETAVNMKIFSLSMCSLFSTESVNYSKFRKLYNDLRNDSILYVDEILPISKAYVGSLDEFFEIYKALSFTVWNDNLEFIITTARKYYEQAMAVKELHQELLLSLKPKVSRADEILLEFKDMASHFQKEKEKLEAICEKKYIFATALFFIPIIGQIACYFLCRSAKNSSAMASAANANAEMVCYAKFTVKGVLCKALENFINGVARLAGFFEELEMDLKTITNKGNEAKSAEQNMREKKWHYEMMKERAGKVRSSCGALIRMIPNVRTDFLTIPREGYDKNYVDSWLEEKLNKNKISIHVLKSMKGASRFLSGRLLGAVENKEAAEVKLACQP